jgi:hypothetical protein
MNTTETEITSSASQALADLDAVMKSIIDCTPLDSETSSRIDERADRITQELRRLHGEIDVVHLLRDARDEICPRRFGSASLGSSSYAGSQGYPTPK